MEVLFFGATPSFYVMSTVHFYCVLCGSALQTSADSRYELLKCPCCSRYVPVPRPVNGPGNTASYPPVFPPDVLGLLVKFQCGACQAVLHADARYEGHAVVCSSCGAHAAVPRWSNTPSWPLPLLSDESRQRASRRAAAPTLSVEEIDFLRGTDSGKSEAVA